MELSGHEGEIPIPLNSSFGGGGHGHGHGHLIHHDHHHPSAPPHNNIIISSSSPPPAAPQINPSNNNGTSSIATSMDHDHHGQHHHVQQQQPYKKMVRYRECLKNHAAAMGGNATDGCGEFMPSGEEGSIEALTCSACNCHRNFHRKEIEGESQQQQPSSCDCYPPPLRAASGGRKLILGPHHHKSMSIMAPHEALGYHIAATPRSAAAPLLSYNMGSVLPSESDEQEDGGGGGAGVVVMASSRPPPGGQHHQMTKKRFRTKFTQEQKDKMLNFAEKVGWKIQKQEESVVQQFCQEIGVKRRVLKVWMHNNKHNLAKKMPSTTTTITNTTATN